MIRDLKRRIRLSAAFTVVLALGYTFGWVPVVWGVVIGGVVLGGLLLNRPTEAKDDEFWKNIRL